MKTAHRDIPAYITLDGSEIRELMHPSQHGGHAQSLAEATVPPGGRTVLHRHVRTEELYHVTAGTGRMTLGGSQFDIVPGDTVLIPPGTPHRVEANCDVPLVLLCCCSPAYAHEDTELLEGRP
jgi:mannose-6-phosphate isomerase-like protein (cupin superfamily)